MNGPENSDAPDFNSRSGLESEVPGSLVFASPFQTHVGTRIVEWRAGFVRVMLDIQPFHRNRQGVAHGGVILTLLDEAGGAAGNWTGDPAVISRSVTVDLNGRFTAPARGDRLIATGTVVSQGRSIYFVRSEVHDEQGTLVAIGSSTHRWRRSPA